MYDPHKDIYLAHRLAEFQREREMQRLADIARANNPGVNWRQAVGSLVSGAYKRLRGAHADGTVRPVVRQSNRT